MKKTTEDILTDAIIDLGLGMKALQEGQQALQDEIKGMRKDMNHHLDDLNHRVGKLEKHQQKTNAELGEIRLTFIQYAETTEKVIDHEMRLHKIERKVFK